MEIRIIQIEKEVFSRFHRPSGKYVTKRIQYETCRIVL
jgi:hypothetical protein